MNLKTMVCAALLALAPIGLAHATDEDFGPTVTALTTDGVTVYGTASYGGLDNTAPLILLFHQGGSNGRGEYAPLVPWLNGEGFRVIAWDQRAGGAAHGSANRTKESLPGGVATGYCDTYADMEAALNHVIANRIARRVILWGSSYSAALVFRLAAEHPNQVMGILSFSPASGAPMEGCEARQYARDVAAPAFILRPASEMARPESVRQRFILTATGAEFKVVQNGSHGSSMLVDARTGNDMSVARQEVMDWLKRISEQDF